MKQENIKKPEITENLEELKTKLIDHVNTVYSKKENKNFDCEYLKPLRDKYTEAINRGDATGLEELAERIISKLDYDRKYRDEEEERARWEELNSIHQRLLLWIEFIKEK